jgi:ribosomal RNA assembly protein
VIKLPVLVVIPEERVPILIGKDAEVRKEIESKGKCTLNISSNGNVEINAEEVAEEWRIRDIILAIGRGFNPILAMKLFLDDFYLEVLNLRDYLKTEHAMTRQKSRIIGTQGKTKKTIEEVAGVNLSIYGHTIAMIGDEMSIALAKQAILMFLDGKSHSTIYMFLEQKARMDKMFLGAPPRV